MSVPQKLYKYENWNERSLANLKNQQLYFSDPRSFNDPFDCSIDFRVAEMSEEEFDQIHSHFLSICPDKNVFRKKFGDTCNESFKSYIIPVIKDRLKEATDMFFRNRGVTCFSESNIEILMWSHYAKSHTGFCLEFDTSFAPFSKAREVDYSKSFPELNPTQILIDKDKFEPLIISLTKHKSWKYEKEWRAFHAAPHTLYRYSSEALTGIYFGANMDPAHSDIIASFVHAQNPDTVFYKAEKSKTKFSVEFKKMSFNPPNHK